MPTTVVEFAQRTYSDQDYQARLRRPVWLEGFGFSPVIFHPPAVPPVQTTLAPAPSSEPPPETVYVPATYQEPPPDVELEPAPPAMPEEPAAPKTSPWVWVAGGTGAAVVVFWLFFRRKRKG